ncbi:hypothetical protein M0813_20168 [Anaeramoeba flamelloides]|uniref:Uncharacterized protein n=1 Tax=Anaeramoeba flamelloides TaxID=1746091 RepID=A0ABQ8YMC6_9EUKA|nr:hypothetical protein M0813_20168 [Anaeramoeba flamelloides]
MTDLENESKEDYFFNNQNQDQKQIINSKVFIMNNSISLNYNHSNSSSVKNSKSILNALNFETNDFKGGIVKKVKNTTNKKKPKTKKKSNFKKNKTDNKRNKRKNRNNDKNSNNRKTDNNNEKKSKNKKSKNSPTNNTFNSIKNKNNTNLDNNTKIKHMMKNIKKNNMTKNINKTPNSVKNNTIKTNKIDKVTIKNTIYRFIIEDDEKLETDLENILPSSEKIDNIFKGYERKSETLDSRLTKY